MSFTTEEATTFLTSYNNVYSQGLQHLKTLNETLATEQVTLASLVKAAADTTAIANQQLVVNAAKANTDNAITSLDNLRKQKDSALAVVSTSLAGPTGTSTVTTVFEPVTGPSGPTGATGPTGGYSLDKVGPTGPAGPVGLTGKSGPRGSNGSVVMLDSAPTSGSTNAVTSGGLYKSILSIPVTGAVTIGSSSDLSTGDPYVALLCHFNGSDTSRDFVDTSYYRCSKDNTHSERYAILSTAQKKFGTASLLVQDNNYAYHAFAWFDTSVVIGTQDFTLEGFIRPSASTLSASNATIFNICSQFASLNFRISYLNKFTLYYDGQSAFTSNFTYTIAADTWYHVAVVRVSNTTTVYVNGVSIGSKVTTSPYYISHGVFGIGGTCGNNSFGPWNVNFRNGYIDEVRFSVGTGRYTSDFTPPSEPFPDAYPVPQIACTPGMMWTDTKDLYVCTSGGQPGQWAVTRLV